MIMGKWLLDGQIPMITKLDGGPWGGQWP